jgi:hypothetical protein
LASWTECIRKNIDITVAAAAKLTTAVPVHPGASV